MLGCQCSMLNYNFIKTHQISSNPMWISELQITLQQQYQLQLNYSGEIIHFSCYQLNDKILAPNLKSHVSSYEMLWDCCFLPQKGPETSGIFINYTAIKLKPLEYIPLTHQTDYGLKGTVEIYLFPYRQCNTKWAYTIGEYQRDAMFDTRK